MDNGKKRSIEQALGKDLFHPGTRKTLRRSSDRKAVGKAQEQTYAGQLHETTAHTIPLDIWDSYFAYKNTTWGLSFSHSIWEKIERPSQDKRRSTIVEIRNLTNVSHVYYLCIPVERRPKRTLPADPYDCSTSVLVPISEILRALKERNTASAIRPGAEVETAPRNQSVPEQAITAVRSFDSTQPSSDVRSTAQLADHSNTNQPNATPSEHLPGGSQTP